MDLIEAPVSIVEEERIPCPTCNRKFAPDSLTKHVKVCVNVLLKKREKFDSAKQRIKGTELAEFVSPVVDKPKKKPLEYSSNICNSAGNVKVSKNVSSSATPSRSRRIATKTLLDKSPVYDLCPYCNRSFGPRSFDRHKEWCKEQFSRIPSTCTSPATQEAKERMDARKNYRASFRSKRSISRERSSATLKSEDSLNSSFDRQTIKSSPELRDKSNTSKDTNFIHQNVMRCNYKSNKPRKKNDKNEKEFPKSYGESCESNYSDIQKWIFTNNNTNSESKSESKLLQNDYNPFEFAEHQLRELLRSDDMNDEDDASNLIEYNCGDNERISDFMTRSSGPILSPSSFPYKGPTAVVMPRRSSIATPTSAGSYFKMGKGEAGDKENLLFPSSDDFAGGGFRRSSPTGTIVMNEQQSRCADYQDQRQVLSNHRAKSGNSGNDMSTFLPAISSASGASKKSHKSPSSLKKKTTITTSSVAGSKDWRKDSTQRNPFGQMNIEKRTATSAATQGNYFNSSCFLSAPLRSSKVSKQPSVSHSMTSSTNGAAAKNKTLKMEQMLFGDGGDSGYPSDETLLYLNDNSGGTNDDDGETTIQPFVGGQTTSESTGQQSRGVNMDESGFCTYEDRLEQLNGMLNLASADFQNSFVEFQTVLKNCYEDSEEFEQEYAALDGARRNSDAREDEILERESVHRRSPNEDVIIDHQSPMCNVADSSDTISLKSTMRDFSSVGGRSISNESNMSSSASSSSCVSSGGSKKISKFCHDCGAAFPIATAKFCCQCGIRRLSMSVI